MFIYNIGHHVYPSNWNFYTMEKFNWSPADIGWSMGLVGVLSALVQGGLIRIVIPKLGAPRTALIGLTAAATAYAGIAFAPSSLAVYLWCVMSALAGLAGPAVSSIMANQVPQNQQGELQGINASVGSLAAVIGPILMTQSFAWFTNAQAPVYFPGAAFLIAALLTTVAVALFLATAKPLGATAASTHQ